MRSEAIALLQSGLGDAVLDSALVAEIEQLLIRARAQVPEMALPPFDWIYQELTVLPTAEQLRTIKERVGSRKPERPYEFHLEWRVDRTGYAELDQVLQSLGASVYLTTFELDDEGAREYSVKIRFSHAVDFLAVRTRLKRVGFSAMGPEFADATFVRGTVRRSGDAWFFYVEQGINCDSGCWEANLYWLLVDVTGRYARLQQHLVGRRTMF